MATLLSGGSPSAPSGRYAAVTPHDTNELAYQTRSIYVGGAGNLTVIDHTGTAVTFTAVPAGTQLRIRTSIIKSTGTTATAIVAMF